MGRRSFCETLSIYGTLLACSLTSNGRPLISADNFVFRVKYRRDDQMELTSASDPEADFEDLPNSRKFRKRRSL